MVEEMRAIPYGSFRDRTWWSRIPLIGEAASVWFERGMNEGVEFENWIRAKLEGLEATTFGQLLCQDADPGSVSADPRRAYRLVVTASDVSNQRLALLPWDFATHYPTALEDPDTDGRSVADAVCCSMAIPLFYRPRSLSYTTGLSGAQTTATMVDGGMLSNFPVWVFDRTDSSEPRWPTFGSSCPPAPVRRSPLHRSEGRSGMRRRSSGP